MAATTTYAISTVFKLVATLSCKSGNNMHQLYRHTQHIKTKQNKDEQNNTNYSDSKSLSILAPILKVSKAVEMGSWGSMTAQTFAPPCHPLSI